MRVLFLTLLSAAACLAALPHPLSDEFIAHLNSVQSTWKAGRNFAPTTSMKAIRSMMGVLRSDDRPRLPVKEPFNTKLELPTNFDAREQWTQCASIGHIRDQSTCGSCWAFGAVEAMTDRICIATNGKTKVSVSSENLLTCCDTCGDGCDGGYPEAAWQYWVDNGIVTGGDYGTNDGCQAYYFPSCEHHVPGPKPACGESKPTPPCKNTCDSRSTSYSDSLTFGKSSYQILGEDEARQEIYTNGPVEGSFDVYADFLNYKTGVYEHTDGDYLGGHAIKILGWGEENGTPYWLVANSWNPDWGDKGFFKIKRGSNECGIEDGIVGGMPKV